MKAAVASAILAFGAGIANAAQAIPANAQSGLLHLPIDCKVLGGLIDLNVDAIITATAPITGRPGQQVYYNDVSAALTIPQLLTLGTSFFGVASADVNIKLNLDLTNASPASFSVFPNGYWVNGTKFNPFGQTTIFIPSATGVLPAIGPVTLGAANSLHTIALGTTTGTLYLRNAQGGVVLGPLDLTCAPPTPNSQVGVLNILNSTTAATPALSPAIGSKPSFPAVGLNQETGCFSFDYSCKLGIFGPFTFPTTACGSFNRSYAVGQSAYLSGVTSSIVIPSNVVDATRNLFKGAATIKTSVQSIYLGLSNATPAVRNGFPTPYNVTSTVPKSGSITLTIPPTGSIDIGPFVINNAPGQRAVFTIGNSSTSAQILDSTGKQVGNVGIICQPPKNPFVAVTVPITAQ